MNYSQQRNCILNIVVNNPIHPTAEQVYAIARKMYPKISLGTVYRNLNQLAEHGILKKICNSYGNVRFDARVEPHFHMTCNVCGLVYDVELPEMLDLDERVKAESGFEVTEYEISIKGVCARCHGISEESVQGDKCRNIKSTENIDKE